MKERTSLQSKGSGIIRKKGHTVKTHVPMHPAIHRDGVMCCYTVLVSGLPLCVYLLWLCSLGWAWLCIVAALRAKGYARALLSWQAASNGQRLTHPTLLSSLPSLPGESLLHLEHALSPGSDLSWALEIKMHQLSQPKPISCLL